MATETGLDATIDAQVDSQIQAFSGEGVLSGEGSEAFAEVEHKHHKKHHRNKKAAKKHHKKAHHQKSAESLVRTEEVKAATPVAKVEVKALAKAAPKPAPVAKSLVGSKAKN